MGGYTRIEEGVPMQDMFVDVIGTKADGSFKQMKVFYRAKPKKEYFVDNRGIRRTRTSSTGFILQKPHKDFTIIAWKEHRDLNDIVTELNRKE